MTEIDCQNIHSFSIAVSSYSGSWCRLPLPNTIITSVMFFFGKLWTLQFIYCKDFCWLNEWGIAGRLNQREHNEVFKWENTSQRQKQYIYSFHRKTLADKCQYYTSIYKGVEVAHCVSKVDRATRSKKCDQCITAFWGKLRFFHLYSLAIDCKVLIGMKIFEKNLSLSATKTCLCYAW